MSEKNDGAVVEVSEYPRTPALEVVQTPEYSVKSEGFSVWGFKLDAAGTEVVSIDASLTTGFGLPIPPDDVDDETLEILRNGWTMELLQEAKTDIREGRTIPGRKLRQKE